MSKATVTAVLALDFVAFFAFGLAFIVMPEALLSEVDLELTAPSAFVEIRAMYGGLQLGLAVFIATAMLGRTPKRAAILVSALTLGGLATARLIGMPAASTYATHLLLLGPEAFGAIVNAYLYSRMKPD